MQMRSGPYAPANEPSGANNTTGGSPRRMARPAAASVDGELADHRRLDIGRRPAPVAFPGVGLAGKPDNPGGRHDGALAVAAALAESAAADPGSIENIEPQPVIRAGAAPAR